MSDYLQVDPDELKRHGVNLDEAADLAARIRNDLRASLALLGDFAGSGEIATAFHAQFDPGLMMGDEMLALFIDALLNNGGDVRTTGRDFTLTDQENTIVSRTIKT